MTEDIDYVSLLDVAKMNLNERVNETMRLYKEQKDSSKKKELINLLNDRQNIFLFDKETIRKYLI
jgi:hypothetical protein